MTGVVLRAQASFNRQSARIFSWVAALAMKDLERSLQVACLDEFIREQPDGLDTQVGSRGLKLSGGQRQRLAICRMVLRKPQIVILDEATSALDPQTENEVHKRLKAFLKDRTTITVAHRLSAVKRAEKIYVFENGKIIQDGSHDDLDFLKKDFTQNFTVRRGNHMSEAKFTLKAKNARALLKAEKDGVSFNSFTGSSGLPIRFSYTICPR